MSKNFELLEQLGSADWFNMPGLAAAPTPQKAPPAYIPPAPIALGLRRESPNAEITKLVQRLFSKTTLDHGPRVVSFSGVSRDDRSSWICARAGEALAAHVGASVCIVDANLWSPQLHGHANATNQIGLADALTNEGPIRSFAKPFSGGNLWLISAGQPHRGLQVPVERYRARFNELRADFEYILISSPPMTRITEATLMGQLADGVVLIIEANQSRREVVRRAKEHLESTGVSLLGAVLDQRTFPIPEFLYSKL